MITTPVGRPESGTDYGYDLARNDPRGPGRLGDGDGTGSAKPPRRWLRRLLWSLAFGVLAVVAVAVYFLSIRPLGVGTSLVAFTAALVPVSLVLGVVWWLDRYTPQPRITLVFAFAWGSAASVGLALLLGTAFQTAFLTQETDESVAMFLNAVVQAPLVEESMKSAGLLVLLLFGRRFISGPLDGVVYAALIGGGFAFTENILYFGRAFAESQAAGETDVFWQTFLLRGLLSPFAHVSFTSLCGLGLGIAAERRSLLLYLGLGTGGLSLGMCLHALWNGASFFLDVDPDAPLRSFFLYYLSVQVPIFVLLAAIVIGLRWRERRVIRRRLGDYGRAGWFTPDEVRLLQSMRRRRRAEGWAGRRGALARIAMRDWIRASIELALHRNSAVHARPSARIRREERELLERITADRRLLGALTRPVARVPVPAPASAP